MLSCIYYQGLPSNVSLDFLFNFFFERDRESERGRGRKRGRERISSRLPTVSMKPNAELELMNR